MEEKLPYGPFCRVKIPSYRSYNFQIFLLRGLQKVETENRENIGT